MNNDELRARLIQLTRDLVLIPSTESRPHERERCFQFVHNHLDSIPGVQVDPYESNGFKSLVAHPEGVDEPDILMCGHIDVIEHAQSGCYQTKLEDGRIYGPGAGDMKGQDAILIELLNGLHRQYPGISLGLALTSDEERGGMDGVRYLCEEEGLNCGVAIIPDGGSLNDVTLEEKGVLHAMVHCVGKEAHGARPWLGQNALELLMTRLMVVREHFLEYWPDAPIEEQKNHWFPTCSITIFGTDNTTPNRIPDQASATLDIRFPPPFSVEAITNQVRTLLGENCTMEALMTAEPTHLAPDPLFSEITEELTQAPVRMVRASGGSDSRFFRERGTPVNLSRPLVGNLHAIDEWIDIESMVTYYRICERYIERKLSLI